jgi:catalase
VSLCRLSRFPTCAASPASIVDALKSVAGAPPKERASFVKRRCVHGIYVLSDRAEEITKSRSFTKPSRVLARFSVGGGNPKVADTNNRVLRGFWCGDPDRGSSPSSLSLPLELRRTRIALPVSAWLRHA